MINVEGDVTRASHAAIMPLLGCPGAQTLVVLSGRKELDDLDSNQPA